MPGLRTVRVLALSLMLGATGAVALQPDRAGAARRDCEGSREGNCNDQQNNDSYGQCKYVCPTFDKSPVDHSFNFSPTVCVMPGSCPDQKKDQPAPKDAVGLALSGAVPLSLRPVSEVLTSTLANGV